MKNEYKHILIQVENDRATIRLNRPEHHNALHGELIAELHAALDEVERLAPVHFVVIAGEGRSFCAGADIGWFARAIDRTEAENTHEFCQLADLLKKIDRYPKITIAAAHKNVLGGANGILSACDFAIAEQSTVFAFGEVKLGIIPATILPFVAKRVSTQNLKKLMFSGERIWTAEAHAIGLVDFVAADGECMTVAEKLIAELQQVSPNALKACKQLIAKVESGEVTTDSGPYTAAVLAGLVASGEGQEGLRAFLEKRKPDWNRLKSE